MEFLGALGKNHGVHSERIFLEPILPLFKHEQRVQKWQPTNNHFIDLMLPPNNNYHPYQGLPTHTQGNYTFDLQVNVDFNNRKVNLALPSPPIPFIKKPQIPIAYPEQILLSNRSPYQSGYSLNYQTTQPFIHPPPPIYQPTPVRAQPPYNSAHNPQQIQQSYIMRYSDRAKGRSANETYPDTSYSWGIEKSEDAVDCVICDKPITREHFHDHLEEHKGRRRDYAKKEPKPVSQTAKLGSFSVRNPNSMDNVAQFYRQHPSQVSQSYQSVQAGLSKLDQSKSVSRSRQIQNTHSRIVYAPRYPSQAISGANLSSHTYSQSYTSDQIFQGRQTSRTSNQVNAPQARYAVEQEYYPQNGSSRANKVSSTNMIPYQVSQRQDLKSLSQSKHPIRPHYQQNSRSSSQARGPKYPNGTTPHQNNYLDTTEPRVVNSTQKRKQPSFEDIEQSVIHRMSDISRDHSILQLKKQLNIQQIEEQSSQEQQHYASMQANPATNLYTTLNQTKPCQLSSSGNTTDKLSRSRLPVNYLAREEFIVNSMLTRSCYKSRHSGWK